jgi:hypothetical protein
MLIKKYTTKRKSASYNKDLTVSTKYYEDPPPAGAPIYKYTTTKTCNIDNGLFRGCSIKDFHKLLDEGWLMPHTYFYKFDVTGSSNGTYEWWSTTGTRCYYNGNIPNLAYWILTEDEVAGLISAMKPELLVTNAAAKIDDKSFDFISYVGELKDLPRLFKGIYRWLRTKPALPKGWWDLPSHYLAVRYGWRPLINDINSINALIKKHNEKRGDFYDRHKGVSRNTYSTIVHNGYVDNWSAFSVISDVYTTIDIKLKGSVCADVVIPPIAFNPMKAAWQLKPFSFVWDWLFNVGKSISALGLLLATTDYTASWGAKITVSRQMTSHMAYPKSQYASGIGFTQFGSSRAELEVRTPCAIPIIPQWRLNMDEWKGLDAISLAIQGLRSFLRK